MLTQGIKVRKYINMYHGDTMGLRDAILRERKLLLSYSKILHRDFGCSSLATHNSWRRGAQIPVPHIRQCPISECLPLPSLTSLEFLLHTSASPAGNSKQPPISLSSLYGEELTISIKEDQVHTIPYLG